MNAIVEQQDLKKERILEAAYNRFLHYGYSKTTMNEIASDLSMSKALIYYYFPDKCQLYIAVMRKLADDYIKNFEVNSNTFSCLREAFIFQINTQHEFIVNNYNFFDFFRINEQNLPDLIWEIVDKVHQHERDILIGAINSEVAKGTISPIENTCEIVSLLFEALNGVSVTAQSQKKVVFYDKVHLNKIHQKRLLLAEIFIKGLLY